MIKIWENWEMIVGASVALLLGVHGLLLAIAKIAHVIAEVLGVVTPSDARDDEAARAVEHWSMKAAAKVEKLRAWLPTIKFGGRS